jgi:hypothetical protein
MLKWTLAICAALLISTQADARVHRGHLPRKGVTMIPEITEAQLKLMVTVCNANMSVFSQTAPQDNDPLDTKVVLGQAEKDTDHLVSLKLLKEITEDHKEQIERTNVESGRTWRVFELTCLGKAMFQAFTSPIVQ